MLTPIPGTALFRKMKEGQRILTDDLREYDGTRSVFSPRHMTAERLGQLFWWLNRKVFAVYSIVRRTIVNPQLWRRPSNLFLSVYVNLHYRRYIKRRTVPNIYGRCVRPWHDFSSRLLSR